MNQTSSSYRAPRPRSGARAFLAASGAAALIAGSAAAQDTPSAQTKELRANEAQATNAGQVADSMQGDIIVTAQRRNESLSTVPISIATYTRDLMDRQGIRRIDDIARLTPELRFTQTAGVTGNNGTNITIRGVASDVGSSTTAVYIDDTPIQIRNVGYFGGNPYPRVFDLERVEVLRGPQGTLFGASAEGGAVRFITPQPNTDEFHAYSRSEIGSTEHGALSYEGGLAAGGPLSSTLAIRVSGWYRHDGGYIDQVAQQTNNVIKKDVNSEDTYAIKFAATWKPTETLTITPGVFYQTVDSNARSAYWEGYGNAGKGDYKTGVYNLEPTTDHFVLPTLRAQIDIGKASIISNTSYLDRSQDQALSYLNYFSFLRSGSPFGTYTNKNANNARDFLNQHQRNFTQEMRVQSYDNELIDWTFGAFYTRTKQNFTNYTQSGRILGVLVNGFRQFQDQYSFVELITANDRQLAGYASVDVKPIDRLKTTLAARYTHNKFDFSDTKDGPTNSGVRTTILAGQKENAFTPKATISYQVDPNNLVYATASKGFRPGGAQGQVSPDFCGSDLRTLGLTASPTDYSSDSLWNYEAGSKNKLFDGKVNLDVNGYYIKWRNIQQSIRLPTCGFSYISNLGSATGKGGVVSLSFAPVRGITVGGNIGYTKMTYDGNIVGGNGLLLRASGQRIGGPLWSGLVYGQIERPIGDRMTGYARADYSFATKNIVQSVSGTFGFDPGLTALNGTNFVSLRVGGRLKGLDLSVFADNLLNSNDLLARNHDGKGSPLYYNQSYRPRTIGLTAQFSY